MRLHKLVVYLFAVFLIGKASGQNSLKEYQTALKKMPNGKQRVDLLLGLYEKHYQNSDDSLDIGLNVLLEAYHLAIQTKYDPGRALSAYQLGSYFTYSRNLIKATRFLFEALKYAETTKNKKLIGKTYQALGVIYYDQKKWSIAIDHFKRCSDNYAQSTEKVKLSTPQYLLGLSYLELQKTEQAKTCLNNAKKYAVLENDSDRLSQIFFGLGRILLIEKKHVEALKLFKEVESNMVYTHEKVGLAVCYENIAQVFYQMGEYDSALVYGRKANFFVNSTRFGVNKMEINLLLSNVFKAINNNDSSIHYLRKHLILKDSIIQQDITTQITLANSNYEFEKMENKFSQELLTSQRRKNVFILLTSILFAISIIVFVFFRSIKKARKKSEELLLNILPKHTTEELKNYGKAIPRHHESVSIMFCDVQNFTIISEKLSPDFLVNMLDFYFSKFDDIITDHGIEKIKTIGDAYMCAAGLTPNGENHAKSAVNAAIEMMAFVKDIENFMMEKYGNAFHFRIGIHSGEVVSGVVGKKKYAYDIWGDTVNLAARMEQNSMPGEINITKTTLDMLNDEYRTTSRGNISAKNKGEVAMYFVNAK